MNVVLEIFVINCRPRVNGEVVSYQKLYYFCVTINKKFEMPVQLLNG